VSFAATNERLSSSQEFAQVERFGKVVVGAGVQESNHGFFFIAHRHYENRRTLAVSPHAAEQLHSAHLRQHQVEQHRVVFVGLGHEQSFLTVMGNVNRVPCALTEAARDIFR
jgi:hypothetical protein